MNKENKDSKPSLSRREAIKACLTLPILGVLGYGAYKKFKYHKQQQDLSQIFNFSSQQQIAPDMSGKVIRLGIIGAGIRGKQLMRALGFAEPNVIENMRQASLKNSKNTNYQNFLEQDDLNIVITGICDIYDKNAEIALKAGANKDRHYSEDKLSNAPKRYKTYKELLAADDIDAVVIATPDHWHSTMTIDAANAGKHVYVEKPLSWTVPETYRVRDAVKRSGVVFQLGHQGRQTDSYLRAKEIIDQNLLGKISLIEMCTNRNSDNGAWRYNIDKGASSKNIDWQQFNGPKESIDEYLNYMHKYKLEKYIGPDGRDKFSLERFFRWRCWWDYSTGLSGDLLTHEYDAINQILGIGIPSSATSSGGVYVFKDGRTVPDVLQTTFEFADRDMTMLYSATQASSRSRGKVIMGRDASLEISNILEMRADNNSTQYAEKIKSGLITPGEVFYTYIPGADDVDAITSPTELYFAKRGLLYTYLGGKRYNTTHLHMREWLYGIRNNAKVSCDIDQSFEEAISAHMGTCSFLEGRTMYWDKDKEEIVRS